MTDVTYCSKCGYIHKAGSCDNKNAVNAININSCDLKTLLVKYKKLGKRWRRYFNIEDDVDLLVMEVVDTSDSTVVLLSNGARLIASKSQSSYNNYVWVHINREDAINE